MNYKSLSIFDLNQMDLTNVVHPIYQNIYLRKLKRIKYLEVHHILVIENLPKNDGLFDDLVEVRKDVPFSLRCHINNMLKRGNFHRGESATMRKGIISSVEIESLMNEQLPLLSVSVAECEYISNECNKTEQQIDIKYLNSIPFSFEMNCQHKDDIFQNELSLFLEQVSHNKLLNLIFNFNGQNATPISQVEPYNLLSDSRQIIFDAVTDWGMSYEDVVKVLYNPDDICEPVCGVSASNVIRLFLDTQIVGRNKVTVPFSGINNLKNKIKYREKHKNYVAYIMDGYMGHAYVIRIPPQYENEVKIYIYQSDLGDGVTRELKLSQWMKARGRELIPLNKLITLIHGFMNGHCDKQLMAEIFDYESNVSAINSDMLEIDKSIKFSFDECSYDTAYKNIKLIKSNVMQ
ncbi:cycle-inhibiting factor [Aliivibrio fischeri]|uniref:Cycle-inhibiting factor n=1 Tax=Aliivibrio fischeri TaxID=668 RepID=A0A844P7T9_ALIFS|nr:cycle-inhibiting factor [Aliivibrio fischeri]MUK51197.1 cycle-inhibiting factor [Aliivibrio fischeri]